MSAMKALLVVLFFVTCYKLSTGLSLEHLQKAVLRNRRYTYQSPELCELDGTHDNICFYGSQVIPYQITLLNSSTGNGIVVDHMAKRVAFLECSGKAVILDHNTNTGVHFNIPSTTTVEFPDIVKEYNVSHSYSEHQLSRFTYDEYGIRHSPLVSQANFEVDDFLLSVLGTFGAEFTDYVKEILGVAGTVAFSVMKVFYEIIKPISIILAPIVILATKGYLVLKAGVLAIWKIFKTLAKFAMKVVGGIATLASAAISIPLGVIVVALNGLMGFFLVLYEIAKKLTLADVLGFLLASPFVVFEIVAGLGGMVLQGVAGVFTILFHIIKLVSKGIISAIKSGIQFITNLVLQFFGIRVTIEINYDEHIQEGSQLLLDLFKDQNHKNPNRNSLEPLVNFAKGVSGKKPLKVYGIDTGLVIKILTDINITDGFQMASAIVKVFSPFNIPNLFNRALAGIFSNSVALLANERELNYVQHILPGIIPPPGEIFLVPSEDTALLNLPTHEIIEKIPTLHAVFKSLEKYGQSDYNISVTQELETDPEFNNLINLAIRRIIAY